MLSNFSYNIEGWKSHKVRLGINFDSAGMHLFYPKKLLCTILYMLTLYTNILHLYSKIFFKSLSRLEYWQLQYQQLENRNDSQL